MYLRLLFRYALVNGNKIDYFRNLGFTRIINSYAKMVLPIFGNGNRI